MDANNKYTSKYLDIPNSPLYPFGYGLSYTTFEYGEVKSDRQQLRSGETLHVSITAKNTGNYDGRKLFSFISVTW